MITATLQRPWLVARLPRPMRVLSWAPHGGGWAVTDHIRWREVKNRDLTPELDALAWFGREMAPWPDAVGMMTSRDIGTWEMADAVVDGVAATALVTLGLSNAEAVGTRRPWHPAEYGTINLAVALSGPGLTETAQLEAMSIAVEARTAAVMDAGLDLPTGRATGTGTDCVALAVDAGTDPYAGLHTAVGEAVGAAVRQCVARAADHWMVWYHAARAAAAAAPKEPE